MNGALKDVQEGFKGWKYPVTCPWAKDKGWKSSDGDNMQMEP